LHLGQGINFLLLRLFPASPLFAFSVFRIDPWFVVWEVVLCSEVFGLHYASPPQAHPLVLPCSPSSWSYAAFLIVFFLCDFPDHKASSLFEWPALCPPALFDPPDFLFSFFPLVSAKRKLLLFLCPLVFFFFKRLTLPPPSSTLSLDLWRTLFLVVDPVVFGVQGANSHCLRLSVRSSGFPSSPHPLGLLPVFFPFPTHPSGN